MNNELSREIDLADLLNGVRRHKHVLWISPLICLCIAIVYLHLAEPGYTVTLKVTPTSFATSNLPASFGGLVSIAGISMPSTNETRDFELYLEGLKSRETAATIAAKKSLLRQLFADEWNVEASEWREPGGFLNRIVISIKRVMGFEGLDWNPPDAGRVNEFLDDELRVSRDPAGPVVTIAIEHHRPAVAQELLSVVHDAVDSALRQKELDRTSAYVAYIKEQLANISVTEYRQALHDILAEQEKRRMIASSDLPFAAEPFGRPTVSVLPSSPRPLLIIVSSVFFGVLLGLFAALVLFRSSSLFKSQS